MECPACKSTITLNNMCATVNGIAGAVCWSSIASEDILNIRGACPSCDKSIQAKYHRTSEELEIIDYTKDDDFDDIYPTISLEELDARYSFFQNVQYISRITCADCTTKFDIFRKDYRRGNIPTPFSANSFTEEFLPLFENEGDRTFLSQCYILKGNYYDFNHDVPERIKQLVCDVFNTVWKKDIHIASFSHSYDNIYPSLKYNEVQKAKTWQYHDFDETGHFNVTAACPRCGILRRYRIFKSTQFTKRVVVSSKTVTVYNHQ